MKKECMRCATESSVSAIGAALVNFVCDYCRRDNSDLHLGRDITVRDMVATDPIKYDKKGSTVEI